MAQGIGGKVNVKANLDNVFALVNRAIGNLSTPADRHSNGARLARENLETANRILSVLRD